MKLRCHGGPFDGESITLSKSDLRLGWVIVTRYLPIRVNGRQAIAPRAPESRYDVISVDHMLRLEYRP